MINPFADDSEMLSSVIKMAWLVPIIETHLTARYLLYSTLSHNFRDYTLSTLLKTICGEGGRQRNIPDTIVLVIDMQLSRGDRDRQIAHAPSENTHLKLRGSHPESY
jgi:hypothetical protein